MSLLSLVVGVRVDPATAAARTAEAAEAVRRAVVELGRRAQGLDVVVAGDVRIDDPAIAHVDLPGAAIFISDVLVLVYEDAPSPALSALAERRRIGLAPHEVDPAGVLVPRDTGVIGWIDLAADGALKLEYPERYAGDQSHERDFADAVAHRAAFARQLDGGENAPRTAEELRLAADALANRLQRSAERGRVLLYLLAFAALTVHAVGWARAGAVTEYGLLAAAVGTFMVVRLLAFQSRHQDYRTISEALRVRAVWAAIGVDARLDAAYLPMQQTELAWIRDVLRIVSALDHTPPVADDELRPVVEAWIMDQEGYFRRQAARNDRDRRGFTVAIIALSAIGLIAGVSAFFIAALSLNVPLGGRIVGSLAIWATGTALIAREFVRGRTIAENAKRYQRMFFVFDRALQVVRRSRDDRTVCAVARQLGAVALSEHADWLFVQRERPISLPPAGAV